MDRKILAVGAFFGLTAVILGAFGAHALKDVLNLQQLSTFDTGVRYQFYHALLLLFIGSLNMSPGQRRNVIFYLLTVGIVFFSGSIYLLATDNLNDFNFKRIALVTPIGGLLLIVAWLLLFVEFLKKKS
ncbi:MAG TPA: DUF423 domain-containing protein [Flavobacterium sp.]|jgi:uncharacterized membrane protein YgdD (TMEM256/DUF423 family)